MLLAPGKFSTWSLFVFDIPRLLILFSIESPIITTLFDESSFPSWVSFSLFLLILDLWLLLWLFYPEILELAASSVDTGRNLNVHKTNRRRPGRLVNVLCTFSLRPVFTGILVDLGNFLYNKIFSNKPHIKSRKCNSFSAW